MPTPVDRRPSVPDKTFASGASWSWSHGVSATSLHENDTSTPVLTPGQSTEEEAEQDIQEQLRAESARTNASETNEPIGPAKFYPARTCRICLEVVEPTYNVPVNGLVGILGPSPQVEYISQDAESGRLIRPCKCKGSQRYVHEGCLQQWRHTDPSYGRRNFFECPTCKYKYKLERMRWSRWISSTTIQIVLTISILLATIFLLGFVADPIINLYLDPLGTLTTNPLTAPKLEDDLFEDDDNQLGGWAFHIIKGLTSLGLLGFVKTFITMSPWTYYNYRATGILGGGGGRRTHGGTGRDRLENISWYLVIIGVSTFLWAVWKAVRLWSRRTLEKASERVVDVQGPDEDGVEDGPAFPAHPE